jgi:hydrogenase/urease accessory protein HupE
VKSFLVLGIEHIIAGYDHVLFLLSLLMLGGGLRHLLKTVSAFTIAHSITLSLAVLGIVSLPGRWVESAIALSIVYVAVENFWRREAALGNRWLITFGFGLVHGLGFASILQEFAIPRADLAVALGSFNLGVEAGQIAIVAAASGVLRMLRRWPAEIWLRRLVSAGAAAAGLVWFVQRALLS